MMRKLVLLSLFAHALAACNLPQRKVLTSLMQLGGCYRGSNGANAFAKAYGIGSQYDPKDITYSRLRLSYGGSNASHLWMTLTRDGPHAANISAACPNTTRPACEKFEREFVPQNIYFYAGTQNETNKYPARVNLQIFDANCTKRYDSHMVRRIYSQKLAVYKNEARRLDASHLTPGSKVVLSNANLWNGQLLYSFMTANYGGHTHFWCPVGKIDMNES